LRADKILTKEQKSVGNIHVNTSRHELSTRSLIIIQVLGEILGEEDRKVGEKRRQFPRIVYEKRVVSASIDQMLDCCGRSRQEVLFI